MEAVHETYRTPWISDLVSVREFRDLAHFACSVKLDIKDELRCSVEERIMQYFGDQDIVDKQEESCSAKLLDADGDLDIEFCTEFTPPQNNQLLTLKLQAQDMAYRNQEDIKLSYKHRVYRRSRYKHCSGKMEIIPKKQEPSLNKPVYVPVEHPEVILTVQVFQPQETQPTWLFLEHDIDRDRNFKEVDQQFLVLGSQYLTEVRDAICCQSDSSIVGEISEDPYSEATTTYKDIYKSGFFYINGVFYNDMRDPQNKDYSKPIIEWSKTAHDVGPFSVAKMEETKFIDLEMQLGLPYVYQHQGHCEHLLVFSDLRLMSSRDRQNRMDYPLTQVLNLKPDVRCMACLLFVAKWVTTEDSRLCELPFFFCDKCFMAFNYDVEGKKIADFKAYKYVDKTTLF